MVTLAITHEGFICNAIGQVPEYHKVVQWLRTFIAIGNFELEENRAGSILQSAELPPGMTHKSTVAYSASQNFWKISIGFANDIGYLEIELANIFRMLNVAAVQNGLQVVLAPLFRSNLHKLTDSGIRDETNFLNQTRPACNETPLLSKVASTRFFLAYSNRTNQKELLHALCELETMLVGSGAAGAGLSVTAAINWWSAFINQDGSGSCQSFISPLVEGFPCSDILSDTPLFKAGNSGFSPTKIIRYGVDPAQLGVSAIINRARFRFYLFRAVLEKKIRAKNSWHDNNNFWYKQVKGEQPFLELQQAYQDICQKTLIANLPISYELNDPVIREMEKKRLDLQATYLIRNEFESIAAYLPPAPDCILDLGCGTAAYFPFLQTFFAGSVIQGADRNMSLITGTQNGFVFFEVDLMNEDAVEKLLGLASPDIILMRFVLQHFHPEKVHSFLRNLYRFTGAGTRLLVIEVLDEKFSFYPPLVCSNRIMELKANKQRLNGGDRHIADKIDHYCQEIGFSNECMMEIVHSSVLLGMAVYRAIIEPILLSGLEIANTVERSELKQQLTAWFDSAELTETYIASFSVKAFIYRR